MTLVMFAQTLTNQTMEWAPFARGWLWPLIPLLWVLVIGLIVWLVTRRRPIEPSATHLARQVLAERYARGELSTDEYHERLENLR